jgi:uncharacterized protein GlcG (DUF336 family)
MGTVPHTSDIDHAAARAFVARAVAKAEDLGVRGAVAVVGGSGVLVSASRMDRGGAGGMARARSKAWIAATQQMPSHEHLRRMSTLPHAMERGFVAVSPEAVFPGAGGMPIARHSGAVEAGIAASGATMGPFVDYPGAVREKLIANGQPANCEDLLVHYALERPYEGQHGNDMERWVAAYGEFPADPGEGLGMAEVPPAQHQPELDWAIVLADRAIAEAVARGVRIAVAIVDHRGDPIQQDWMNGAPTASVNVAQAIAATAATFCFPSHQLGDRFPGANAQLVAAALPFPILGVEGGLPIGEFGGASGDSGFAGGVGIAGPDPALCAQIAASAIGGA